MIELKKFSAFIQVKSYAFKLNVKLLVHEDNCHHKITISGVVKAKHQFQKRSGYYIRKLLKLSDLMIGFRSTYQLN